MGAASATTSRKGLCLGFVSSPNNALQLTAYSLRFAPASGSS
jgi:hypothetical protein